MIAKNKREVQTAVGEWANTIRDHGMRMNVEKSKVMAVSKNEVQERLNISWEGQELEQVDNFEYLGTQITCDGRPDSEVRHRVHKANQVYYQLSRSIVGKREI